MLGLAPDEEQSKGVLEIIEQAVINAMLEEGERCSNVARVCCSPDLDRAHKIAEQIRRQNQALIANLSSLR